MKNRIFQYYLLKKDLKSAMRIKSAFYRQELPHRKDIKRKKHLENLFLKLKNIQK